LWMLQGRHRSLPHGLASGRCGASRVRQIVSMPPPGVKCSVGAHAALLDAPGSQPAAWPCVRQQQRQPSSADCQHAAARLHSSVSAAYGLALHYWMLKEIVGCRMAMQQAAVAPAGSGQFPSCHHQVSQQRRGTRCTIGCSRLTACRMALRQAAVAPAGFSHSQRAAARCQVQRMDSRCTIGCSRGTACCMPPPGVSAV
jgi:hypothetical protein